MGKRNVTSYDDAWPATRVPRAIREKVKEMGGGNTHAGWEALLKRLERLDAAPYIEAQLQAAKESFAHLGDEGKEVKVALEALPTLAYNIAKGHVDAKAVDAGIKAMMRFRRGFIVVHGSETDDGRILRQSSLLGVNGSG